MIGRRAWSKPASTGALAAVYLAALSVGATAAGLAQDLGDWQSMLIADVVATLFVFVMAVVLDNTSVYDPYWSVAPVPIAAWWAATGSPDSLRWWLVFGLILLWSIRLTGNFLSGWRGLNHEDWRYTEYRRLGTGRYWLVSLTGLQMMPTLLVFGGLLPVLAVTRASGEPLSWLDWSALTVTLGAILLEGTADYQKSRFDGEGFVTAGLWGWLRHPNYLGEVLFWWGLWLFALSAGTGNWWTVAGPAAITILFVFISVPLMDRRMVRRPGYAEHMKRVPALVPRRPR